MLDCKDAKQAELTKSDGESDLQKAYRFKFYARRSGGDVVTLAFMIVIIVTTSYESRVGT
jgi:hypothetical protein